MSAIANLEDLPPQSCGRNCIDRSLCGPYGYIWAAICVFGTRPWPTKA